MSLLLKLPQIMEKSRDEFQKILDEKDGHELIMTEHVGPDNGNMLVNSDNILLMRQLLNNDNMKGSIDLIYIDPPFYSGSDYGLDIKLNNLKGARLPAIRQTVYHDTWENGMEEYLTMLSLRFLLMKELLADTGSLIIHLDWHVVHYVKILLDDIFGEKNFVNEIIWQYKSGGVSKRYFAKKHDTLLFYAKGPKYHFAPQTEKSYNRGYKPYRFKGVKEYRDEMGWYTMVNMKDVWSIDMVGRTSSERTGYATQKPEALIARILESCTKEGDRTADFFGGSGTLAAVSQRMGRKWISCDKGQSASGKTARRLANMGASYGFYEEANKPWDSGNKLKIHIRINSHELTDTQTIEVEICDYVFKNINKLSIDEKYLATIKEVMKKDSLQLLDYWSIDFNYDGKIFRPAEFLCRENGGLPTKIEREGTDFSTVAVRAVDVFGNSSFKVLRQGEEWV